MFRGILTLTLSLCLGAAAAPAALAQTAAPITEQEAHAIGVDAYVYFYSAHDDGHHAQAIHQHRAGQGVRQRPDEHVRQRPEYPPADFKGVVRPNFDTLYSIAWLDLTKEPVVISAPDTGGRYYLLPMLDMWTDVFASPGWRTTGTQAGTFLVTPPGWRPDLRDRFIEEFKLPKDTQRIDAPTPYVWIIGRTKTDGPPDYDAVHKIQAGYKVTPLSEWGKTPKPVEVKIDPSVDMKTPPKIQVDTMPAGKYFAYAAELLKLHPPHITDEPIIAQMKKIGIEPGKSFDIGKLDPAVQRALETAPEDGAEADGMEGADAGAGRQRLVDEHRHDGRLRQLLSQARHRRAARPWRQPARGRDLSAQPRRRNRQAARWREQIHDHFREGRHAAGQRLLVDHALRSGRLPGRQQRSTALRSAAGCRSSTTPTARSTSISRTKAPARTRKPTGFPRRREPFNLTMRLYAPKSEALTGKWNPPPVVKTQTTVGISAQ